jgi:hypothetical protein
MRLISIFSVILLLIFLPLLLDNIVLNSGGPVLIGITPPFLWILSILSIAIVFFNISLFRREIFNRSGVVFFLIATIVLFISTSAIHRLSFELARSRVENFLLKGGEGEPYTIDNSMDAVTFSIQKNKIYLRSGFAFAGRYDFFVGCNGVVVTIFTDYDLKSSFLIWNDSSNARECGDY